MSTQQSSSNSTHSNNPRRVRIQQGGVNPSERTREAQTDQISESHNPSAETTLEEIPVDVEYSLELETPLQGISGPILRRSRKTGDRPKRGLMARSPTTSKNTITYGNSSLQTDIIGQTDSISDSFTHPSISDAQRAAFVGKSAVVSFLFLTLLAVFSAQGLIPGGIAYGIGSILAAYTIGAGKTWYQKR